MPNTAIRKTRTEKLRQRCLDRKRFFQDNPEIPHPSRDGLFVKTRVLRETEDEPDILIRRSLCCRERLLNAQFDVDELEILMGRLKASDAEASSAELEDAMAYLEANPTPGGQTGHCELDLSALFDLGIDGLRKMMREKARSVENPRVYRAFSNALDGFSAMIENAAHTAESAAENATSGRRTELLTMADSCRHIAHKPPRNFHDAIQLLWFADLAVMYGDQVGLVVPGHLDRTLRSYYEADIANGDLSREYALELIESLYILINEYVPDGLAMSVMVGGRDANGNDLTNDLSYLCLEALRRTAMIYPTVGICWNDQTPDNLTALAVELISEGYTTPAFFGDETIQRGLKALDVPPEEACYYINSTCVEITPSGASNAWVASPYFNVCGILLEEIDAQVASKSAAINFEEFLDSYNSRLSATIANGVAEQNERRRQRKEQGGKPLQSVFTRSCIEREMDIDEGGATYNWVECSFVGLPNLADSLRVIREEIFESKQMDFSEMKRLTDTNFDGAETTRLRLLNRIPKYGNADSDVDALFADMVDFVSSECARHQMEPDGSAFVPGAFCWVMHRRLGSETRATPDGRKAGFPFADGAGPAQGRESNGPTAAILSTTSWDHSPMIGGMAFNIRFSRSLFSSETSKKKLRDLILTYLDRGGFEIQVNIVDQETLKAARANPEQYRDLTVRIGGYVDYFTRLKPDMQDEIMMRTEFGIL